MVVIVHPLVEFLRICPLKALWLGNLMGETGWFKSYSCDNFLKSSKAFRSGLALGLVSARSAEQGWVLRAVQARSGLSSCRFSSVSAHDFGVGWESTSFVSAQVLRQFWLGIWALISLDESCKAQASAKVLQIRWKLEVARERWLARFRLQ